MKWTTIALALPVAVLSAPQGLRFQQDYQQVISEPEIPTTQDSDRIIKEIPSLDVEEFLSIERIKEVFEDATDLVKDTFQQIEEIIEEFTEPEDETVLIEASPEDVEDREHGPPHVIDFSDYTILEILNATLHNKPHCPRHGHHDKESSDDATDTADVKRGRQHRAERDDEETIRVWPNLPWPRKPPPPPKHPKDLPLHRLAWVLNHSSLALEDLKKDDITLLAPDDMALTPPHRRGRHGHDHGHEHRDFEGLDAEEFSGDLENLDQMFNGRERTLSHPFIAARKLLKRHKHKSFSSESDDDEEERKKKIDMFIGLVLRYHTLKGARTGLDFVDHSTVATTLNRGPEDKEFMRLKVEPTFKLLPRPHPTIKFNFYAEKRGPSIKAKNGIIHLISAPLAPPLSALNELYLFPQFFSTLTSSLQKVELTKALQPAEPDQFDENAPVENFDALWQQVMSELTANKVGTYTVFAPTNLAFWRLGLEVNAFLQLPFKIAHRILKYIIAYHIVPDVALYSDYIQNNTASSAYIVKEEVDVPAPHWLQTSMPLSFIEEATMDSGPQTQELKIPPIPGMPRPRRDGPPPPPPPPPPRDGPHHGPPHHEPPHHEPPHHPKEPHQPPGHRNVNITHYTLPTLLTTTGVNSNATLNVAIVSFKTFGGKGPIQRDIYVIPHHPEHHHGEKDHKKHAEESMCPGREHGPRPVKVAKTDAVVRDGVIQPVRQLLAPPRYHHKEGEKGSYSHHEKAVFDALFA